MRKSSVDRPREWAGEVRAKYADDLLETCLYLASFSGLDASEIFALLRSDRGGSYAAWARQQEQAMYGIERPVKTRTRAVPVPAPAPEPVKDPAAMLTEVADEWLSLKMED